MSIQNPIVGHKTFMDSNGFRHEPLRENEANEIMARVEAATKRRAELMPTEQDAARMMFDAWYRLKELGWRETTYGPTKEPVLVVEPGSSGMHKAVRNEPWPEKTWWSCDSEMYPMNPCLFKPLPNDHP